MSHDASQDKDNQRIRRVDIATGATTTLAGTSYKSYDFFDDAASGSTDGFLDGAGSSAQFSNPLCVAIDPNGTFALVGVRRPPPHPRMPPSRRRHTRLAHGVGAAPVSSAARPPVHEHVLSVLSHDASQDYSNHRIRRVDIATGSTGTLAGSGTRGFLDGAGYYARFQYPRGIAIEPSGAYALVAVRVPLWLGLAASLLDSPQPATPV